MRRCFTALSCRHHRAGGFTAALALEHLGPGVAQDAEMPPRFHEAIGRFLQIALEQSAIDVFVEGAESLGELAAVRKIQSHIQLVQDFLRSVNIVVNRLIRLGGIFQGEAVFCAFEEADRSLEQHQNDLTRRRSLERDLAV